MLIEINFAMKSIIDADDGCTEVGREGGEVGVAPVQGLCLFGDSVSPACLPGPAQPVLIQCQNLCPAGIVVVRPCWVSRLKWPEKPPCYLRPCPAQAVPHTRLRRLCCLALPAGHAACNMCDIETKTWTSSHPWVRKLGTASSPSYRTARFSAHLFIFTLNMRTLNSPNEVSVNRYSINDICVHFHLFSSLSLSFSIMISLF